MTVQNKIPTKDDWGIFINDEDVAFSYEIYGGRSNDEMMERFRIGMVEILAELRFIPTIPFQYYIFGWAKAVLEVEHDGEYNADSASCFLQLLLARAEASPEDLHPIFDLLKPSIEYVVNNQSSFEADVDIYGDFKDIYSKIQIAIE